MKTIFLRPIIITVILMSLIINVRNSEVKYTANLDHKISECMQKVYGIYCSALLPFNIATMCIRVRGAGESKMFDLVYIDMIKMTEKVHRPRNKCVLRTCLNQLKSNGFIHIDVMENVKLLRSNYYKEEKKDIVIPNDLPEFTQAFCHHIKEHKDKAWELMNLNSYCIAQTCIYEITVGGSFGANSGISNQNLVNDSSTPGFFTLFASKPKSKPKSSFTLFASKPKTIIQKYTYRLQATSTEEKKINKDVFCMEETCLMELVFGGFDPDFDGKSSKDFYNNPKKQEELDALVVYAFIKSYLLHLKSSGIDNPNGTEGKIHLGPKRYCEFVSQHGI